jgi:nicotinamidase-related amidase
VKGAPLPPISPKNTAIVVHDMQKDFLEESLNKPEMIEVVKKVKSLLTLARSLSMHVIYTRVETDPGLPVPKERADYLRRWTEAPRGVKGTVAAEVIDELKPEPTDHIVTKIRSSAFYGTKFETLLRVNELWILVIVGGGTNWGVEWLARDAKARDVVPVVLRDCTYTWSEEAKAASLANIDDFIGYVMDWQQVVQILSKSK